MRPGAGIATRVGASDQRRANANGSNRRQDKNLGTHRTPLNGLAALGPGSKRWLEVRLPRAAVRGGNLLDVGPDRNFPDRQKILGKPRAEASEIHAAQTVRRSFWRTDRMEAAFECSKRAVSRVKSRFPGDQIVDSYAHGIYACAHPEAVFSSQVSGFAVAAEVPLIEASCFALLFESSLIKT